MICLFESIAIFFRHCLSHVLLFTIRISTIVVCILPSCSLCVSVVFKRTHIHTHTYIHTPKVGWQGRKQLRSGRWTRMTGSTTTTLEGGNCGSQSSTTAKKSSWIIGTCRCGWERNTGMTSAKPTTGPGAGREAAPGAVHADTGAGRDISPGTAHTAEGAALGKERQWWDQQGKSPQRQRDNPTAMKTVAPGPYIGS